MAHTRLKFRLHRTAIVLICLALLVALMQGASYFQPEPSNGAFRAG